MATITVEDVRAACPDVNYPDSVIEGVICMVNEKVGDCLDQSYEECEAKNIQTWLICHILELMANPKRLSGFTTPNGTSESYQNYTSQTGLGATSFGQLITTFDTSGCVQNATNKPFWIASVGSTNKPRNKCGC